MSAPVPNAQGELVSTNGLRPLPMQLEVLRAKENVIFCAGGWGATKTTIGGLKLLQMATIHSWHPWYGNSNPLIAVIAPTSGILESATLAEFLKLCPPEWITKADRNKKRYELENGCIIQGWSGNSRSFEGVNPCFVWIDEAHKVSDYMFRNAMARYRRDRIAGLLGRPKGIILTGIPYLGGVLEENFRDESWRKKGRRTFHLSALDNPYLDPEQKEQNILSCPAEEFDTFILGRWGAPQNAIYPTFSIADHVRDDLPIDPHLPFHVGVDEGKNYCTAVIAQECTVGLRNGRQDRGLNVIDELILEGAEASFDHLVRGLLDHPSGYGKRIKTVCVDPDVQRTSMGVLQRAFPGATVVQRTDKKDPGHSEYYGIQCVKRALRDADGNVRLRFHGPNLRRTEQRKQKGSLHIMRNYRWKANSHPPRPMYGDRIGDHAHDCVRYLVVNFLPVSASAGGGFRFVSL